MFSFFKKQPEKMPERVAVKPKAPVASQPIVQSEPVLKLDEPLPELEFTAAPPVGLKPSTKASVIDAPIAAREGDGFELDLTVSESDSDYSVSSVTGVSLDHDVDSIQLDIEQVAVLFSNGQDALARSLLEGFVQVYRDAEGLRVWNMLFDLLQLTSDRAAFDQIGTLFAETWETSPPAWRDLAPESAPAALVGVRSFFLQGMLTAENIAALDPLKASLVDKRPVRIGCGKWIGCDDEIAGLLADSLREARKKDIAVTLDQLATFIPRLRSQLTIGEKKHAQIWLLVLELLQRYGSQAQFEAFAIDFALTFERSPPAWEVIAAPVVPGAALSCLPGDAHYLTGEIKNARFDELPAILKHMDTPVLDFSCVRRLDFFSAGQLANRLEPLKEDGLDIVIRNPNHLVAELMGVVGLNRVAQIIVPKT